MEISEENNDLVLVGVLTKSHHYLETAFAGFRFWRGLYTRAVG